jgi:hypothetical protein
MVKIRMYKNKVGRAYHLRDFGGGGNEEPNDTLNNAEYNKTTTSPPTRTGGNAPPVSKGCAKGKKSQCPGEGAASRRA